MIRLLIVFLAALSLPVWADNPTQAMDAGLAQAKQRHAPVLVDFHAPWCYSCYYMQKNVLNGAEWEQARHDSVLVELDADSSEGAYWMKQWNVKSLPSYVVLNEKSEEIGRIIAEQTRFNFYRQLNVITGHHNTLAALQARVAKGGMQAIVAARSVLQAYHARRDADAGLAWFAALASNIRTTVDRDIKVQQWLDRLQLQKTSLAKDKPGCLKAGAAVLKDNLGCDYAYELDTVMACAVDLPQTERGKLFQAQRHTTDKLVQFGAFGSNRCADQRSIVFTAADLYASLDDKTAERKVLERAIADTEKKLGADLKKDRNLADNLRVYLDRAGETNKLDALLKKLIASYPDDYVYPYRYGKSLLERGKPEEALPLLEQAAQKAYGINRLKVAEQRVQALKALNREDDAKQAASEALEANGPWFPEEVEKLKALL